MSAWRRANLAGQPDLAKGKKALGKRPAAQTGCDRQHHGQVGGGLADTHTAHRIDKHILVHAGHARMPVQHGQQHGQTVAVQPHAETPGRRTAAVDQRLDFDQHGARAFQRDHDAAAGHRLCMLAQENGARVAHTLEAFFGHGEHTDFIDRTKTVFDRAHKAKA